MPEGTGAGSFGDYLRTVHRVEAMQSFSAKSKTDNYSTGCGCFIMIVVALLLTAQALGSRFAVEDLTATVLEKEAKGEKKYLVWTDNETFIVADSWVNWRWNSSDVYGVIKPGKVYKMRVTGWRLPFLSWHRNILRAEVVQ